MKLKALFLALAVAGAGSSYALAEDGHGHHGYHHGQSTTTSTSSGTTTSATTTTTPADCRRLQLRGTLGTVSAGSFTLVVQRANDEGQSLVGQTVTIGVDAHTRVEWEGEGTLTGPNPGDQARVKALSCPGATAGTSTLTARSVRAHGAENEQHDGVKAHHS